MLNPILHIPWYPQDKSTPQRGTEWLQVADAPVEPRWETVKVFVTTLQCWNPACTCLNEFFFSAKEYKIIGHFHRFSISKDITWSNMWPYQNRSMHEPLLFRWIVWNTIRVVFWTSLRCKKIASCKLQNRLFWWLFIPANSKLSMVKNSFKP